MIIVKTPLGLGDNIYCWPIVRHLAQSQEAQVLTTRPYIFENLGVECLSVSAVSPNIRLHYNQRRNSADGQYQDILTQCRLPCIPFQFVWGQEFESFNFEGLKAQAEGKKICLIREPSCNDMHKKTGDFSMAADFGHMQRWVDTYKDEYFYVSVGKNEVFSRRLCGINVDLVDKLSLFDYITLCEKCDAIATQIGHLVVLAQAFNKPMKVFEPKHITDSRMKNMSLKKIHIEGLNNAM